MSNDTPTSGHPVPMATPRHQRVVQAARAYSDARTRDAGQEEMQKVRAEVAKAAADLVAADAAGHDRRPGARYMAPASDPTLYVDATRFALVQLVDELYVLAAGMVDAQDRWKWDERDERVSRAAAEHTLALARAFVADAEAPA